MSMPLIFGIFGLISLGTAFIGMRYPVPTIMAFFITTGIRGIAQGWHVYDLVELVIGSLLLLLLARHSSL